MTDRRAAIKKLAMGLAGGTLAYGSSFARGAPNRRRPRPCRLRVPLPSPRARSSPLISRG